MKRLLEAKRKHETKARRKSKESNQRHEKASPHIENTEDP